MIMLLVKCKCLFQQLLSPAFVQVRMSVALFIDDSFLSL